VGVKAGRLPTATDYSTPLVLGTSLPPVFSMAWRMASATALNADSELRAVGVR
jgi:hypothetical protein